MTFFGIGSEEQMRPGSVIPVDPDYRRSCQIAIVQRSTGPQMCSEIDAKLKLVRLRQKEMRDKIRRMIDEQK